MEALYITLLKWILTRKTTLRDNFKLEMVSYRAYNYIGGNAFFISLLVWFVVSDCPLELVFKVGLSPSKKTVLLASLKEEKCFLFRLKSSFRSQDI